MKKALYGEAGKLSAAKEVTAREFLAAEGLNPKKWIMKPYCQVCGRQVDVNFSDVDPLKKSTFSHITVDNGRDCPLSFKNQKWVNRLSHYHFDVRAAKRVLDRLKDNETFQLNKIVTKRLWHAVAAKNLDKEGYEDLWSFFMRKSLHHMECLAEHPHLFPYLAALTFLPSSFSSSKGVYRLVLAPEGEQELSYRSLDGSPRTEKVPESLVLSFVNRDDVCVPRSDSRAKFLVSKESSRILAGQMPIDVPTWRLGPIPFPRQLSLFS
jgi:hypothetical protein